MSTVYFSVLQTFPTKRWHDEMAVGRKPRGGPAYRAGLKIEDDNEHDWVVEDPSEPGLTGWLAS